MSSSWSSPTRASRLPATALARPRLQSPADGETVNPSSILFRWFSVGGGECAAGVGYAELHPARTFSSPDGDSRMALPGGADNQTMSATFNISAMFPPRTRRRAVDGAEPFWRWASGTEDEAPLGG